MEHVNALGKIARKDFENRGRLRTTGRPVIEPVHPARESSSVRCSRRERPGRSGAGADGRGAPGAAPPNASP